jgi:putative Ig domain-containing protein
MNRSWVGTTLLFLLLPWLPGCGGGSSSPPPPPPPPPPLAISTTSIPDGTLGQNYSFQLQATGGSGTRTWIFAPGGSGLPSNLSMDSSGIISGFVFAAGSFSITPQVQDTAGHTATKTLALNIVLPPPPVITTSILPDARVGTEYSVQLDVANGAQPFAWSLVSGATPINMNFGSGVINGFPTSPGSGTFTVAVTDLGGRTDQRTFTLKAVALPGRNDSIATATTISNGTFTASLSPFSDGGISPDTDFYKLTADPGTTVAVSILAQQIGSTAIDSVIEILDTNGQRLQTCRDPFGAFLPQIGPPLVADPNPTDFDDQCINDDDPNTGTTDSSLEFHVPGANGGPAMTFYVHVLDWNGRARPDLAYQLVIVGAN